ncbi:MAG: FHA domain-containing protein [Anaerolineae bacterium]|nr:FHA domain-containing protein [Anaerolineae bacterium]
MTVGRAPDNDLIITPEFAGWETVSRHHARIYRRGENWVVEDLGSTNGIYINGRRTGRNLLRDGWRLEVGSVAFTFRAGRGGAA